MCGVFILLRLCKWVSENFADTLHRFWKKEHDWGWKKFMELTKMSDGFIDADTLIIKAQVQVIRCAIIDIFVNLLPISVWSTMFHFLTFWSVFILINKILIFRWFFLGCYSLFVNSGIVMYACLFRVILPFFFVFVVNVLWL